MLLLVSNDDSPLPECRSVLYVRPRDPYRSDWVEVFSAYVSVVGNVVCREMWDGPRAGTDGAVDFLGVDEVSTTHIIVDVRTLYLMFTR